MSDTNGDKDSARPQLCPHCGQIQAPDAIFCAHCGARLTITEAPQNLKFSGLSLLMLLTLPIASIFLGLGSCIAAGAVTVALVRFDWKLLSIGAGALLVIIVLAQLLRFFQR